jgi:hypothetical protein
MAPPTDFERQTFKPVPVLAWYARRPVRRQQRQLNPALSGGFS